MVFHLGTLHEYSKVRIPEGFPVVPFLPTTFRISGDLWQYEVYSIQAWSMLVQFLINLLFLVETCGALKDHFTLRLRMHACKCM